MRTQMGKIFKNVVICHTNDFKGEMNDKIKGWVEHNGGRLSKELTSEVTHVISSLLAWKRYTPLIREARRKKIRIVKLDWLVDSLTLSKNKRLDETGYYFEQCKLPRFRAKVVKTADADSDDEKEKKAIARAAKVRDKRLEKAMLEFDEECRLFTDRMASEGYHLYQDSHGFMHLIDLVRWDDASQRMEKHRVQLYESDEKPFKFALFTHYLQGQGNTPLEETLMPIGSGWDMTWTMFCKFFKQRTGRDWQIERSRCCTTSSDNEWTYEELFRWERKLERRENCCAKPTMILQPEEQEKIAEMQSFKADQL